MSSNQNQGLPDDMMSNDADDDLEPVFRENKLSDAFHDDDENNSGSGT